MGHKFPESCSKLPAATVRWFINAKSLKAESD